MTGSASAPRGERLRRNVLFVSTVSGMEGGAERSLLELAEGLRDRSWTVSLAVWRRGGLSEAFDRIGRTFSLGTGREPASPLGGVMTGAPALDPVVRAANSVRLSLRPVGREAAWLEESMRAAGAVLIHSNCDLSPLAAAAASRRLATRWVAHVRDDWRAWFHPRVARALGRADAVVAPSLFLASRFRPMDVEPVVIPNPVSGSELRRSPDEEVRASLRAELAPGAPFIAAVVGRLDEQKGSLRVVEAAGWLRERGSRTTFVLAGRGSVPMENRLRKAVEAGGLAERIRLLGHRRDVARWLPATDCLVVPSTGEPFGRMIVEGMHAGLPVVSFRDGAAPEIITDGSTGVLVPPEAGAAGLAAAVLELEADPARARRLGEAARGAASAYEPAPIAGRMESLYLRLLGE